MRPTSFRAHEFLNALVSLAQSTLSGVRVIDGPAPSKPSEKQILMVGWAPWIDRHAVASREDEDVVGRMTEQGEVACYIAVGHGDTTIQPMRARAVEILEQIEEAVRDNPTLNGSVDEASVGPNMTMTQHQDRNEGASIGLSFAVRYAAYI